MIYKVLFKKMIGRKPTDIIKPIVVAVIIYFSFVNLDIVIFESSITFHYLGFIFCSSLVFKVISENEGTSKLGDILVLPVNKVHFNYSYIGTLILYVIVTKFTPVVAIVLGLSDVSATMIGSTLIYAINGCIFAFLIKDFLVRKKWTSIVLYSCLSIVSILIFDYPYVGLVVAFIMLYSCRFVNPYNYFNPRKANKITKQKKYVFQHLVVWRYFFRYISDHKIYMANTLALFIFAMILPMLLKGLFPISLAILSINTPIGILISSQRGLNTTIEALPHQKTQFMLPYFFLSFSSSMIANIIAVISDYIMTNSISMSNMVLAILFAVIGATITVTLEIRCRIEKWNVESDLWHHPRKYVVPAILLVIASVLIIL